MARPEPLTRARRRLAGWTVAVLVFAAAPALHAQGPPEAQVAGAGANGVPAASPGLNLSAAQNPFLGGVVAGQATPGVVPLSLADAIARGLKQNLGAVIGEQATRTASANRLMALNGLLPNAYGRVGEARQVVNLAAYGFPLPPGTNPLVGPLDVVDARVYVSQTIFNWSAIQSARAGGEAVKAATYSYRDARDGVVFTVASLYLAAVTGASQIEAVQAQVKTAQALYDRATDLKTSGMVPAIDVLRAQVQLQAQQQRLIFHRNEFAKRKLALARAIGLPLDQQFDLSDKVPYAALAPASLDESLKQACASRADLQAAQALVRAAEDTRRAALGSALPSVGLTADIGTIGLTTSPALRTYSIAAGVRIPIFEGTTVRARVLQADAALQQQRAQLDDLRARVDYEVRTALLDLKAADDRVQVARGAVDLASQQLAQAQDRFSAGVASNLEVVQAQEAVATASDNCLSSLHAHNLAKISLARALGVAEADASRFLGGTP
jgi:outer membrane protein TolC